jgi:hypothetical protein
MVLRIRDVRKVGGTRDSARRGDDGRRAGSGMNRIGSSHTRSSSSPPWTWPLSGSSGDTYEALGLNEYFSELSLCRKPHNPSVSTPVSLYSPIEG